MKIRRSARIIVGIGGVLLVWYGLLTGVFDTSRYRKTEPSRDETLLHGRVTFDDGPVTALIEIRAAPLDDDSELELPFGRDPVAASVETNEEGRFQFVDVPAGRYEVRALGPEGTVARRWVEYDPEVANPPVELGLETGEHVLVGRAGRHLAAPFDGFVLAYTRGDLEDPGGTWTAAVRPDDEGRFEIAGFREREVCLAFLTPGEYRSVRLGFTIPHVSAASAPPVVEFVVDHAQVSFSGAVVDPAGAPIEDAVVTLRSRSEDPAARTTTRGTTNERGVFILWSDREILSWTVAAEGYVTKSVVGDEWPDEPIVLSPQR